MENIKELCGDFYYKVIIEELKKKELNEKRNSFNDFKLFNDNIIEEEISDEIKDISDYFLLLNEVLQKDKNVSINNLPRLEKIIFTTMEEIRNINVNLINNVSSDILKTIIIKKVKQRNTRAKSFTKLIPLIIEPLLNISLENIKIENNLNSFKFLDNILYSYYVYRSFDKLFNNEMTIELLSNKKITYPQLLLNELVKPEDENILFTFPNDFLKKEDSKNLLSYFLDKHKISIFENQLIHHLVIAFGRFFGIEGSLDERLYKTIMNSNLTKKDFNNYSKKITNYLLHPNILNIIQKYDNKPNMVKFNNIYINNINDVDYYKGEFKNLKETYEGKGNFKYFERYTFALVNIFTSMHKQIIIKKIRQLPSYDKINKLIRGYCSLINNGFCNLEKLMTKKQLSDEGSKWLFTVAKSWEDIISPPLNYNEEINYDEIIRKQIIIKESLKLSFNYSMKINNKTYDEIINNISRCKNPDNIVDDLFDYQINKYIGDFYEDNS